MITIHLKNKISLFILRLFQEIASINAYYKKTYGADLSQDLESDTSGDFRELLLQLARGERDQTTHVDQKQAAEDATSLLQVSLCQRNLVYRLSTVYLSTSKLYFCIVQFMEIRKMYL